MPASPIHVHVLFTDSHVGVGQLVESNRTLCLSKSAISAALHPVAMRARVCRYVDNGTKSLCNPTT
jgi:hypothetical protein